MKNLGFYFLGLIAIISFSCQSQFEEIEIPYEQAHINGGPYFVSFCTESEQPCTDINNNMKIDCTPTGEGCTANECSGASVNNSRLYTRDINQAIQHANANGQNFVVGRISLDQSTATNKVVLDLLIGAPEVEAYAATLVGTSAFDTYVVSSDYPLPTHVCQFFGVSNLTMKRGTYAITDRTQSGVYFNGKVSIVQ